MSILAEITRKKVALLGLGIENEAMLRYLLKKKIKAEFTICDFRTKEALGERYTTLSKYPLINWKLGPEFNQGLEAFDCLFRSPGWTTRCPGIAGAKKKNKAIMVTSSLDLFMELCPTPNIIGVTGTKGKGTTSSLITAIIKADKRKVYLGGNIGVAPFSFLGKVTKDDYVVLELSSFQLEDMIHSPRIAVFTNFTKEHLQPADPANPNYHRNLKEYFGAKANIFLHKENKYLVANEKIKGVIEGKGGSGKIIYFGKSNLETVLPGEHNLENIAAAEEVAKIIKIPKAVVAKAVIKFQGLEYRLQKIGEWGGLAFYNDSFATTPEATITALRSFSVPIVVLLGGADKGANFNLLAKEVKKRCHFVVLLKGEATPRIETSLLNSGFPKSSLRQVDNIEAAVELAIKMSKQPGLVLLSTACASFGMFKNYKQRGQLFKEAVLNNYLIKD